MENSIEKNLQYEIACQQVLNCRNIYLENLKNKEPQYIKLFLRPYIYENLANKIINKDIYSISKDELDWYFSNVEAILNVYEKFNVQSNLLELTHLAHISFFYPLLQIRKKEFLNDSNALPDDEVKDFFANPFETQDIVQKVGKSPNYYRAIFKRLNTDDLGNVSSTNQNKTGKDSISVPETNLPNNDSGSCFIATAVYGSYNSEEVIILRMFRDEVLLKNSFGRIFINIYYMFGPYWAKKIVKHQNVTRFVKWSLNEFVKLLENKRVK